MRLVLEKKEVDKVGHKDWEILSIFNLVFPDTTILNVFKNSNWPILAVEFSQFFSLDCNMQVHVFTVYLIVPGPTSSIVKGFGR